jgi:ferric-dicitrate binding protein FerR (iron transport regulator)
MNEDLKDILSHLNPEIDQDILLRYLQGHLSDAEQHELEKQMQDSDFEADALEGLENFKDKQRIHSVVEQLKRDLQKKTEKKRAARKKAELHIQPWLVFAVILILVLVVISYFLIHRYLHH